MNKVKKREGCRSDLRIAKLRHWYFPRKAGQIPSAIFLLGFTLVFPQLLWAQSTPRLNSLFPAGGQLGTTVEVAIQGSDLAGAHTLIIEGEAGITAQLHAGGGEVDDTHKPVFEANCGECHELRSPNNTSMTPAQWEATVNRMIQEKGAQISPDAQTKIVAYLTSAARASGGLTAQLSIAPDAPLGFREVRIVGKHGTSTAWPFEVSHAPDTIETETNNLPETATSVDLPRIINGVINPSGDEDYYVFEGGAGERYVFSVKAYRLNNASSSSTRRCSFLTHKARNSRAATVSIASIRLLIIPSRQTAPISSASETCCIAAILTLFTG